MPRLPRLDLIGIPQHVVQRGNDRSPCFIGTADRQRAGRPGVQHESQRHALRQRDDGKLLSSLKQELTHHERFADRDDARSQVFDYIVFYNRQRLHSGLGYRSPAQFEKMAVILN